MRLHLLAVPLAACLFGAAAEAAPGDLAEGQHLYAANCAACHGADGGGGRAFGAVHAANLRSPHLQTLYRHDDALIARAILQAKDQKGQTLKSPMPAWQGRLTQPQTDAIVSYLKTLHS